MDAETEKLLQRIDQAVCNLVELHWWDLDSYCWEKRSYSKDHASTEIGKQLDKRRASCFLIFYVE